MIIHISSAISLQRFRKWTDVHSPMKVWYEEHIQPNYVTKREYYLRVDTDSVYYYRPLVRATLLHTKGYER